MTENSGVLWADLFEIKLQNRVGFFFSHLINGKSMGERKKITQMLSNVKTWHCVLIASNRIGQSYPKWSVQEPKEILRADVAFFLSDPSAYWQTLWIRTGTHLLSPQELFNDSPDLCERMRLMVRTQPPGNTFSQVKVKQPCAAMELLNFVPPVIVV